MRRLGVIVAVLLLGCGLLWQRGYVRGLTFVVQAAGVKGRLADAAHWNNHSVSKRDLVVATRYGGVPAHLHT